jgi:hypothetical protein
MSEIAIFQQLPVRSKGKALKPTGLFPGCDPGLSHCGKIASEVYPLPPVLNHHQVAGLLVSLREE